MYDRRPASRVTVGTPTVAAFTPPTLSVSVRGSCQMAISSPLARAKGPFATANISWMPERTSSESGRWQPSVRRRFRNAGLTALPESARNATVPALVRSGRAAALLRRLGCLVGLLLAAMASAPATAAPQQRIIAVGDLHGDYQAWMTIARAAGLVDQRGRWAGGNATLVQLGDVVDRAPDSLKIIRSLQQLQKEAPRRGGKVVVVLGNHEAMNLLGDNRYTTPGEYAAFVEARPPARREQLYTRLRKQLEATAHAANPKITPEQVRAKWMAEHPLGWVEHRLAWSPSGELG